MMDINLPKPAIKTYGDLSLYTIDLQAAVRQCNAQLESLREWSSHVDN